MQEVSLFPSTQALKKIILEEKNKVQTSGRPIQLKRAFQNIVEINAGITIYLSDIAANLKEGFDIARKVIGDGITKNFVNSLINE